jgi:hypothetical protein
MPKKTPQAVPLAKLMDIQKNVREQTIRDQGVPQETGLKLLGDKTAPDVDPML